MPGLGPGRVAALRGFSRTSNDISLLNVAVSLGRTAGSVLAPLLAVGGVAPHVVRLHAVERAIEGEPLPDADELQRLVASQVRPISDLRGSAGFKRHLAATLAADALQQAWLATEGC